MSRVTARAGPRAPHLEDEARRVSRKIRRRMRASTARPSSLPEKGRQVFAIEDQGLEPGKSPMVAIARARHGGQTVRSFLRPPRVESSALGQLGELG